MIKDDYVTYETAKLLKEKGFDLYTYAYYEDEYNPNINLRASKDINWNKTEFISKPTLQMAMKWLREVYELYIEISLSCDREDKNAKIFDTSIFNVQNQRYKKLSNIQGYEEACEAAIKYCLENLI